MVRNLRWQNVRGMGVVAITGRLAAASLEPSPKEEDTPAKKKGPLGLAGGSSIVTGQIRHNTRP